MRELRAIVEAWLKNRVRNVYDVHSRSYLILGGIAGLALKMGAGGDPWIARVAVTGIVLLVLSATVLAARSKQP